MKYKFNHKIEARLIKDGMTSVNEIKKRIAHKIIDGLDINEIDKLFNFEVVEPTEHQYREATLMNDTHRIYLLNQLWEEGKILFTGDYGR